jgi:hypothetical protein
MDADCLFVATVDASPDGVLIQTPAPGRSKAAVILIEENK